MEKNISPSRFPLKSDFKGFIKIMKIYLLFLFAFTFQLVANNTFAQDAVIELKSNSVTVNQLFNEIEKQTDYLIVYSNREVNTSQKVNLKNRSGKVSEYLNETFNETDIGYYFENNYIVLSKKLSDNQIVETIASMITQQKRKTITGKVVNTQGEAIIGANIIEVGTTNGTITDLNGDFSLIVEDNAILQISYVGYINQQIITGERTFLSIILEDQLQKLDEFVVTALGIKKEKVKVAYAVQEIKGENMVKARESNALSGLTGKIAGLQIANSTNLYGSPDISLRGVKPLIVINGIPIDSDSWNLSSDDIESFSVLKGPAASVLYGSRGKNGAIQITTKRGGGAIKKYSVEFNSSTMTETSFLTIPKVQHIYGSGQNGKYSYGDGTPTGGGINDNSFYIWGPKLDVLNPNTPSGYNETIQWDSPIDPVTGQRIPTALRSKGKNNLYNFLETGLLSTNNIAVNAEFDKGDLRFSATHVHEKGMVPNSKINITTFNVAGGVDLTNKLRLETNITYNRQYSSNYPDLTYNPANFIYGVYVWTGPEIDILDFKDYWVKGREGLQQKWYENTFYNNPYFIANEATRGYYRNNTYGALSAKYAFTPAVQLSLRTHVNTYSLFRDWKYPYSYKSGDAYKQKGAYEERQEDFYENITDILLTIEKDFLDDFDFSGIFGGNYRTYTLRRLDAKTSSLNVPEWYNLGNSVAQIQPINTLNRKKVMSAYGTGEISYKRTYFLNFSGRWDKSSTLPIRKNNYFYPSVGTSIILSRALTLPEMISFLKIRGSWAKVGSDLDIYQTSPVYTEQSPVHGNSNPIVWNGQRSLYYATQEYNPLLEPEFSSSFEVGIETNLFDNRLGFDVSYFESIDGPQIFELPLSISTGKSARQVNGREYKRNGWEIILNGTPIRNNSGINWDITLNWSTYKRILSKIYGDQTILDYIKIGERADAMYYRVTEKSPDGQVVHENGWPKYDPRTIRTKLGNYNPDWSIGLINTFSYKNYNLSFQLDGRIGGQVYSVVNALLWESGRHLESVNQWRDDYNEGKVNYIGKGVKVISGELKRDGEGNIISDTREFAENDIPISYFNYVQYWNARGCYESNIFNKSFLKLREVTFTYTFPKRIIEKTFLSQASISLIGRNLLYFSKFKYTDLDAITGSSDGLQTPSVRRFGININLTF